MQAASHRALYLKAMVQIQAEQNLLPLEESMKPNFYFFIFCLQFPDPGQLESNCKRLKDKTVFLGRN